MQLSKWQKVAFHASTEHLERYFVIACFKLLTIISRSSYLAKLGVAFDRTVPRYRMLIPKEWNRSARVEESLGTLVGSIVTYLINSPIAVSLRTFPSYYSYSTILN